MGQGQGHQMQRGPRVRTWTLTQALLTTVVQLLNLSFPICRWGQQPLPRGSLTGFRGACAGARGAGGAEREGPAPWLSRGPSGFSGWAHLTEVDPDEEVQGEIHLRLEVVLGTRACRLRCSVLEAR